MEICGFIALIKPDIKCEKYIDAFVNAYKAKRISKPPVIIYSMWDGYLNKNGKARVDGWIDFLDRQEKKGVKVKYLHTSGHATPETLAKVINAVYPQDEIIPMHTENPDGFKELTISAELIDRIRKTK